MPNMLQSLGDFLGSQVGALSSIGNMASLFIHMPEEFEAKLRPVPGGFPVVGSRTNFSPMIFTVDIFDTDEVPAGPKKGRARVALPGDSISALGANSATDVAKAAARPKRRSLIPPLLMLVNPEEFTLTSKKVINESFTKGGWVIEHWGEELDTLSMNGKTGGFYTGNFFFQKLTGLTRINAHNSAAYQNLMALYMIYKNNGYNYEKQFDHRRINSVGSVRLYYDWTVYIGSFRSFRILEDAEKPFQFMYSFEFVPRKWIRSLRPGTLGRGLFL